MKDRIVFDIETKNTFADVGGQENIDKLDMSVTCAYSYNENKYYTFWESDLEALGKMLQDASVVIGFAINRFDLPVLAKYFKFNIDKVPRIDLLEEIELAFGSRIGLGIVAETTLGIGKSGHGLDAIEYWETKNFEALEKYCLQDVKVTKELYDFIIKNEYVLIPKRYTNEIIKVPVVIKPLEIPLSLF